jgi:hypothetical protein
MKRQGRHAKKSNSDLDETISRFVEAYGLLQLLEEMAMYESGSLPAAIGRLFKKLDVDRDYLTDAAYFADPPLPEDYWARDLVAVHGMPAVLKSLARHAKGRGWRETFRELSRAQVAWGSNPRRECSRR